MQPHPRTTYVTASPATWVLIRGAYLSGLSAPTVAARFGVSVTAIRKRARREGWTKAAFAATATPWSGPWSGFGAGPAPEAAPPEPRARSEVGLNPGSAEEEAILDGWRSPIHIRPTDLARRALANAAHAVKTGSGLNALRLARAAAEIARLDGVFDWAIDDPAVSEVEAEGRDDMMRLFLREQALKLARILIDGGELPAPYAEARAELERLRAEAEIQTPEAVSDSGECAR